jgi:hypothetical protein
MDLLNIFDEKATDENVKRNLYNNLFSIVNNGTDTNFRKKQTTTF